MYNKIASIILNSSKAAGLSDVYVAQPETLKENLAGKAFLLAEISGKKSEAKKVFDFLVKAIQESYYNDEKIMLRGKIEGLKIENIFEAALNKINKSLADFLLAEKIRLNASATNLTIGIIYENKLHFANFGRNRALLLFRHGERYEVINVEVNAAETEGGSENGDVKTAQTPKLFSSVISGEVPLNSYFIFTSEAMPEYLSGKEMVDIVTKLPPITAAEQIKNILAGINAYVPFLGIIIKNTMSASGGEITDEPDESLTANSSISSLNYTEQKTEEMLAPAGLINFSQALKKIKKTIKNLQTTKPPRRSFKSHIDEDRQETKSAPVINLNLGTVKSLNTVRPDSFLIKEKIFFKKNPGRIAAWLKKISQVLSNTFRFRFIRIFSERLGVWLKNVNQKKRLLVFSLGIISLLLILSIVLGISRRNQKIAQENLDNILAQIEEQQVLIDSHLLYNDDEGARSALIEAQAIASSLPQKSKAEIAAYNKLWEELLLQEEKVQKISHVEAVQVNDLSGLGINSLAFVGSESYGLLYGASNSSIYSLRPDSASSTKTEIAEAVNLSQPQVDLRNLLIYYWDSAKQLIQFNLKTKDRVVIKLPEDSKVDTAANYKVFNNNLGMGLYTIDPKNNQIYRQTRGQSGFGAPADWLKEELDLSRASDLFIDGDIYVLQNNGQVLKFREGRVKDFDSLPISPIMTEASKLIAGDKYFYVFEASSKRLAVLAKEDGHFVGQYVVDSLDNPSDVAVDESGHAAYFLDGPGVYKITLNQ